MNNNEKILINFIHLIENMNYSDFSGGGSSSSSVRGANL